MSAEIQRMIEDVRASIADDDPYDVLRAFAAEITRMHKQDAAYREAVARLVEVGDNAITFTDDVHSCIEYGNFRCAVHYLNEIRAQLNDAIAAVRAAGGEG